MSIPFLPIRSALRAIAVAGRRAPRGHRGRRASSCWRFDAWLDRRCAGAARRAGDRRPAVGRPLDAGRDHVRDRGTLVAPARRRRDAPVGRGRAGASAATLAGGRPPDATHDRARARTARSGRDGGAVGTRCSGGPRTSRSWTTCTVTRAAIRTSLGSWSRVSPPSRARRPTRSRATSARPCCSRGSGCHPTTRRLANGARGRWPADARRRARGGRGRGARSGPASGCRRPWTPARSWRSATAPSGSTTR